MHKRQPKKAKVRRLHFSTENGRLGLYYCLSLVVRDEVRPAYFKSLSQQETLDEVVAATEKYNLKADFKLVANIQKTH